MKVEELKEFSLIENQNGHSCLRVLSRKGNRCAKKYLTKVFKDFHFLVQKTWDDLEKKYNVKCIYALPKKEIRKANSFLGNKLKTIWIEAQRDLYKVNKHDKAALIAIKIVCFSDYGFLELKNGLINIKDYD